MNIDASRFIDDLQLVTAPFFHPILPLLSTLIVISVAPALWYGRHGCYTKWHIGVISQGERKLSTKVSTSNCWTTNQPYLMVHENLFFQGPASFRANVVMSKTSSKPPADYVWFDDQTQPLPRSARAYLHEWIRAEELARSRWNADVAVFEVTGDRTPDFFLSFIGIH